MRKNVASQVVGAQVNAKADGTPVTSGTTTVYVTGDGGTQAAGSVGSGACTHEGHGFWTYAPAQAETNYDHVAFTFENSSGVNATVQIYPSFPQTGDNFARIGAPAGASIAADIAGVQSDTNDLQTRVPAALVSGRMDASVGAMAANVMTAAAAAADLTTELQTGLATSAALATAQTDLDDIQARLPATLVGGRMDASVGAYPGNTAQTGDAYARLGAPAGASVSADVAAVKVDTAAIKAKTDNLPTDPADQSLIIAATDAIKGDTAAILIDTAEIGAAGAGLTALGDTRIANLDATVSSRASAANLATVAGYIDTEVAAILGVTNKLDTALVLDGAVYQFTANALELAPTGGSAPTAADIADAVWDEAIAGHLGAGSTGLALNSAGSAGDPWATALPGAYGAGTAGKIIGDNIDATISSRASQASVNTIDDFVDTEVAAIKTKTDFLPSATAGAAGGLLIAGANAPTTVNITGNLTGNVSGSVGSVTADVGITQAGADKVWASAARTLTSFGTLVADTAAAVWAAGARSLTSYGTLATDVATAVWGAATRLLTAGTNIVLAKGVGVTGFNDPTAAANATAVRTELATELGRVDVAVSTRLASGSYTAPDNASITAIKAKTDGLPSDPADASDIVAAFGTVNSNVAVVNGNVLAVKAKTDNLPAAPAAVGDIPTTAAVADKLLGRSIAGGADGGRTVQDALRPLRNKTSIAGGILTVTEEDDLTPAWTAAVTTAPGDPLAAVDPA